MSTPRQNRSLFITLPVLVLVLGTGVILFLVFGRVQPIPGVVLYQDVERGHDDEMVFDDEVKPPAGGIHHDAWLNCGIYERPVETGNAVHSLEHGAVWITYRPDLPAGQLQTLRARVRDTAYLILSPYPAQDSPIVLTAWAVQLEVETAGDERIDDFIFQYQQGPTAPEPGASCSGGVGEPLQ